MVAVKKCRPTWVTIAAAFCLGSQAIYGIELDTSSQDSIKNAAGSIAQGLVASYHGNEKGNAPGILPDDYSWWESGAMFTSLIDYWHYTGDSTYNDRVREALLHQAGYENEDAFMPLNQTRNLGNSDQAIWGLAALSAAETSFVQPPSDHRQWLELAQSVFDSMALRWDTETCGGGLRWQIFSFNNGYDYKDSISNGGFFNLASRLARFTGNDTYAGWAGKVWDWSNEVGLIEKFHIYDGTDATMKCSDMSRIQWSLNHGLYLSGAASMYNSTDGGTVWKNRVDGLLEASNRFFNNSIMTEIACERTDTCDTDMKPFKSYLARGLASTAKMAPYTQDSVMKKLSGSAEAVAKVCVDRGDGDDSMTICPHNWRTPAKDNIKNDVGNQISALQVIQANLVDGASAPINVNSSSYDASGTKPEKGSPTSSATGSATSTGAAAQLSTKQVFLASPLLSLFFGYFI